MTPCITAVSNDPQMQRTRGVVALERHNAVDDRAAVPLAERLGALAAQPQARRQRVHIPATGVCASPTRSPPVQACLMHASRHAHHPCTRDINLCTLPGRRACKRPAPQQSAQRRQALSCDKHPPTLAGPDSHSMDTCTAHTLSLTRALLSTCLY